MTVLFLLGSLAPSAIATSTTNKIRTTLATKDRVHLQQSHVNYAKQHPSSVSSSAPPMSLSEWKGVADHEDIFQHVRPLIEQQDKERALHLKQVADGSAKDTSLVETGTGVGKVHAFCEICILIMQMKERGQPHLCAGLNPDYFVSCVENLESILRSDKAVVYWLRSGCMHLDREGPEIVKPCPAHAICAWVPNLFADVGIISPRNSLAPLCPRDFKYLPRIPRKPATATSL
jgi:hypothetical protein